MIVTIGISIVVFVNMLKGKVDVKDLDGVIRDHQHSEKDLSFEISNLYTKIEKEIELLHREYMDNQLEIDRAFEESGRRLDSRCDKLYEYTRHELEGLKRYVDEHLPHSSPTIPKKDNRDLLTD